MSYLHSFHALYIASSTSSVWLGMKRNSDTRSRLCSNGSQSPISAENTKHNIYKLSSRLYASTPGGGPQKKCLIVQCQGYNERNTGQNNNILHCCVALDKRMMCICTLFGKDNKIHQRKEEKDKSSCGRKSLSLDKNENIVFENMTK